MDSFYASASSLLSKHICSQLHPELKRLSEAPLAEGALRDLLSSEEREVSSSVTHSGGRKLPLWLGTRDGGATGQDTPIYTHYTYHSDPITIEAVEST